MTLADRMKSIERQAVHRLGECVIGGRVRDEHERGRVAASLLAHGLDADALLGERARH